MQEESEAHVTGLHEDGGVSEVTQISHLKNWVREGPFPEMGKAGEEQQVWEELSKCMF